MNNADSGSATKLGGDNWDALDQYHDDIDIVSITGKPAKVNTSTEIRDGKLFLKNAANTVAYNIKAGTISSNVTLFLPNLSANGTLLAAGGANDWGTAVQTFRSSNIVFRNPANTVSYVWVTSPIVANRNITLPLLTADDTFLFNNFAATLQNKTINLDQNTLKHSTTNAQGDLYKYDTTLGKIIRVPRGTADQVFKVNATGTDVGFETLAGGGGNADKIKVYEGGVLIGTVARKLNFNATDFNCVEDSINDEIDVSLAVPGGGGGSSADELYSNMTPNGNKYGFWNGETNLMGYGLFADTSNFDVTPTSYIDSTNGYTGSTWTISSTNRVGWKTNNVMTMRKLNPDIEFAFQLDEAGDNTGSRFYCGFVSDTNVIADSNHLDGLNGIVMHKFSSDNFFQITHNDGGATAVSDGSILVTNSLIHRIRIFADEPNVRFGWQLDGGTINFISTRIPSSTAQLGVVLTASDNDATTRNLRGFWAKMKMKERA